MSMTKCRDVHYITYIILLTLYYYKLYKYNRWIHLTKFEKFTLRFQGNTIHETIGGGDLPQNDTFPFFVILMHYF